LRPFEQLTRALGQIATLPSTPALRREQIKLQAALIYPLQHVKGQAAPQTKAAAERARLLIEQAEALGEPPEDPLLLLSALDALFQTELVAFDGDVVREDAAQLLALAEKQGGKVPLLRGHQAMASALVLTGNFAEGRVHLDQALALYDPVEHRPLATRFLQDPRVGALFYRSLALWALGYPEAALAGAEQALSEAREIGHAGALMHAITNICLTQVISGNYAIAQALSDEQIGLAEEKRLRLLEDQRNAEASWCSGLNRQSLGRRRHLHRSDPRMALNRIKTLFSGMAIPSGTGLWGAWPVQSGLGPHWRSNHGGRNDKGKVVRGRRPSHHRRNRPDVARAGFGKR